ncbi:hypothetical protein A8C56_04335 [Niabella ginsenosidivorans]|uniref:Uncharacterized protein n=1 Tax=Niabella ginsenosidivorans TaxID=1176587 RepID=A0A1A9HY02_9BACT|nr:hypothetical protein A8C56_04335 [Niabella ginsenosidivorans]
MVRAYGALSFLTPLYLELKFAIDNQPGNASVFIIRKQPRAISPALYVNCRIYSAVKALHKVLTAIGTVHIKNR